MKWACHAGTVNRFRSFRAWSLAPLVVICLLFILAGAWLRMNYSPEWLQVDHTQHPPVLRPWPVEADCYSQLARVQRILNGDGLIQNHFKVENWPEGMVPSTTAPFDYLILLLYAPLKLFTQFPLDWAGALVSPFLWLALIGFWMFFRSREFNLTGKALLLIGFCLMPELVWATAFGHSRHLSLTLSLLAVGLTAEFERWHANLSPRRSWHIFAGIVWGMACWSSLFEPLIVLTLLLVFNLIVRRRENLLFLGSMGAVLCISFLIEGPHVILAGLALTSPPPGYQDALNNWLGSIAEVQGYGRGDLHYFFTDLTLIFLALPLMAWRLLKREGDRRTDWFIALITLLLMILTTYQRRWIYYANVAELLLIARYCQQMPLRWTRIVVISIFLIGLVDADYERMLDRAIEPSAQPSPELAEIARAIDGPGGIMAPWWLSPGLLYLSGNPIVSGSSHCGITGIVDSARFYTATSWIQAREILQRRKVRWILITNDSEYVYPVLNVNRRILGLPDYTEQSKEQAEATVWQIMLTAHLLPPDFKLRAVTPLCRLYEYTTDAAD